MKKIILSLLALPMLAGSATIEDAGGPLGDKTIINQKHFISISDESQKSKFPSEHVKGAGVDPIYTRYHAATGVDFDGRTSDFEGGGIGHGVRSCEETSSEQFVDHEIKIQNGEILQWLDIWGDDPNTEENMTAIVYRQCFPEFSAGPAGADFLLVEEIERDTGNFFYAKFLNTAFEDNEHECKLMVRIRFGDFGGGCAGASDLDLFKVRAQLRGNDLIYMDNMEDY